MVSFKLYRSPGEQLMVSFMVWTLSNPERIGSARQGFQQDTRNPSDKPASRTGISMWIILCVSTAWSYDSNQRCNRLLHCLEKHIGMINIVQIMGPKWWTISYTLQIVFSLDMSNNACAASWTDLCRDYQSLIPCGKCLKWALWMHGVKLSYPVLRVPKHLKITR